MVHKKKFQKPLHLEEDDLIYKQEAHGPHRSPEQQFLVTFYFVAYAISNFEPPFWGPSIGPRFMVGFNNLEFTLFEDPCIVISQTVT